MKFFATLIFTLFLTAAASGQPGGVVSGVVEKSTRNALAGKVSLISSDGQTRETRVDSYGVFRFASVKSGTYTIIFEIDGERKEEKIEVSGNAPVSVNYNTANCACITVLRGAGISEVVRVSAGTSQPIAEVSKTVNIIDQAEINDRNEINLTGALSTVPGFRVQQLGGFGKTANIKTRGLRNQDTAVLIDGVRFRDASSITGDASAFLSDLVFTNTARVEVLRGSGSSLYGTNAIGGVIDLRTQEPGTGTHGSFTGEGGSLGLRRFFGNLTNGTDKFGFTFGASRTEYTKGIDGEDDASNTTANGRVDYRPNGKTNISGRFYVTNAFVRLNSNPDTIGDLPASNRTIINAVPLSIAQLNQYAAGQPITDRQRATFIPDVNDPDNFQRSKFFNGQIMLTQILSRNLTFQAYYSGLRSSRENDNSTRGVGFQSASTSVFDGTIQTANAHFDWTPARGNLFTAGYEYEREKYGNDGFTPSGNGNFSARAKQSSSTFYAQHLAGFLGDRLQIAGGVRAQFFSLKNPAFSVSNAPYQDATLDDPPTAYTFDGSISYFFARTGTKLRAHVGNGYRVPSLYERFGTFYSSFSQNFIALGAPGLKPERSIAYDGGIDQTFFKNRARVSATYFYTHLIETIGFGNVVPNIGTTTRPFGGYINTKGGIARGAEFSVDVKPSRSTGIFASYTFTNSDQREPQVSGSGIIETLGIPKHQFSFVATQRIKNLTLNFDFLATGRYLAPIFSNSTFSTYVYRFDGNRKGDLTGSYEVPLRSENVRLRIFGTFGNIFDHDYYENGFRTEGRTARGGLGLSF